MNRQTGKIMKVKYRSINQTSAPTTLLLHALYSVSKNILTIPLTIVRPMALALPGPNTTSARCTGWHEQITKAHRTTQPSSPCPGAILHFRHRRLEFRNKRLHASQRQPRTHDVHCSRPVQMPPLLRHPIPSLVHIHRLITSANASTEAGGEPRTYNSGLVVVIMMAMWCAYATILQQSWR